MAQNFDKTKPKYFHDLASVEVRVNFDALATAHSGPTPPANPETGWRWFDDDDHIFYIYVGADWVEFARVVDSKIVLKAAWVGNLSDRPAAAVEGRFYHATDTGQLFLDLGAAWIQVGGTTTGFQGAQGWQGAAGANGAQGRQGWQGWYGPGGNQGVQGRQGNQGWQGRGDDGYQGTQGWQGVTGYQGPGIGSQGWQGPQGQVGGYGPQGSQGWQGAGAQGYQGWQGWQGAGVQGIQGIQGTQGNQGITGNQGPGIGSQGWQGPQGAGAQGLQGVQGAQGLGYQGPVGVQGSTGSQGPQGWQGSGTQGAMGYQGWVGAVGNQGNQGQQGIQGPTVGGGITRYQAHSAAGEEIWVLATAAGISYSRSGNTGTFTIPVGVKLFSVRMRIPSSVPVAGQFMVDMGTNDMANSSLANRWGPIVAVMLESTGNTQPTTTSLNLANHSQFTINNLSGAATNHVRLSF